MSTDKKDQSVIQTISTTPTVTGSADDRVRDVDLEKNQGTTVVVPSSSSSTRSPTLVDRHENRLLTSLPKHRPALLLGAIYILVNALWLVWLYYLVQMKVRPYEFRGLVNNKHASSAFEVLLIIVGFGLGYINFGVPVVMFVPARALCRKMRMGETSPRSCTPAIRHCLKKAFSICFTLVVLVYVGIAAVVVVGPFASSFIAVPLAWKGIFRESCDGYGMRVWLDSKANKPAKSVEFKQFEPTFTYRMQFRPDPQESNDFYNVFSLDPGYIPGSSPVMPTYDSIHYNFTDQTYTTKLKDAVIHRGTFQLHPRLRLPDLEVEAELEDFTRDEVYAPFVKVYSTTANDDILDQGRAWSDNTDVMMRAAKFSPGGHLQICARTVSDPSRSLGPMTPIPVGLLVLARAERLIAKPKNES